MKCIEKRFFGTRIVPDEGSELSPHWAEDRTDPAVLALVGRRLLWRILRNGSYREFFRRDKHYLVPVEAAASRQIRWATGCSVGPFPEFQTIVRLLSRGEATAAPVYLLGRNTEELQRIEQNVRATFPGLRVVGRAVFHPASIASVTTAIKKAGPRMVLSGVVSNSFLRWMQTSAENIGPVLTVVTPGGLGRMAGRRVSISPMTFLALPVRVVLPLVLFIHRLRLRRKVSKRSPG
jgi:UDP-N-acetyl-D-mannosaminuronic acid transferase (WecB/TagA/CpsF family)